jgi:flagellin
MKNLGESIGRLSTGLKFNKAADDPAGLRLSVQLATEIRTLDENIQSMQASRNRGRVAEHGAQQVYGMLHRLRELTLNAQNTAAVSGDQLQALQSEVDQILSSIDRVGRTTRYDDHNLLNGSLRKQVILPQVADTQVVSSHVPTGSTISIGEHILSLEKLSVVQIIDGSGIVGEGGRITDDAGGNTNPFVSRDGLTVGFIDGSGSRDIQLLDARDTVPTFGGITLTGAGEPGAEINPHYNTTGGTILYESAAGGQVFSVPTTGGAATDPIAIFPDNTEALALPSGVERILFAADAPVGITSESFVPQSPPFPADSDITGLVHIGGDDYYALDNASNTVYEVRMTGGTGSATVLSSFGLGAGDFTGMAFDGADLRVIDRTTMQVRQFSTAGVENVGGAFSIDAAVTAGVPSGGSTLSVVSQPSVIPGQEDQITEPGTITLQFTSSTSFNILHSDPDVSTITGQAFNPDGSVNTILGLPGVTMQLQANPTSATSVSAAGSPTVTGTRLRMMVSIDGGAAQEVEINAALGSGAAIAAAIDAAVAGASVGFGGPSQYTITSGTSGASSSVSIGGGADAGAMRGAAGAATSILDDGVQDQLTISVDGGPAITYDLATAGNLNTTTDIVNAINAVVPGVTASFSGGRFTITSNSTGSASQVVVSGPAGSAGDLLNLRGVDGAVQDDGHDDLAAYLNLGAANGGTDTAGTGVKSGDTFTFAISRAGDDPVGIGVSGGSVYIGDAGTGLIYEYAGGTQQFDSEIRMNPLFVNETGITDIVFNGADYAVADSSGNISQFNLATGALTNLYFDPSGNGDNQSIAFNGAGDLIVANSTTDLIYQVDPSVISEGNNFFVKDMTTGALTRVSFEAGDESSPALSANGSRFIYLDQNGNVINRAIDGSGAVTLTAGGGNSEPTLSNNGTLAAYQDAGGVMRVRRSDGTGGIFNYGFGDRIEFNPAGGQLLVQTAAGIEVHAVAGNGADLGTLYTIAGATDAVYTPAGDRIFFSRGGDIYGIHSVDGTALTPTKNNAGTTLATTALFSQLPTVQPNDTLTIETMTLTLVDDQDGFDRWTVNGSVTGPHADYVVGTPYVTDDIGNGGGGLAFQLNPDGQYAIGDVIRIDTTIVAAASLDGGPRVTVTPFENVTLQSGDDTDAIVEFGFPGALATAPLVTDVILIEDGATRGGGLLYGDPLGYSINEITVRSLGLTGLSVLDDDQMQIAVDDVAASNLFVTGSPTVVDGDEVTNHEMIFLEWITPSEVRITGTESGVIEESLAYTAGSPLAFSGMEVTVSGTAAAGDTVTLEVTGIHDLDRIDQALRWLNVEVGGLGGGLLGIDASLVAEDVHLQEITAAHSRVTDLDFAEEIARSSGLQVQVQAALSAAELDNDRASSLLDVVAPTLTSTDFERQNGNGILSGGAFA